MRTATLLIATLLTMPALAAEPDATCVLKAADALPKVAGMKIGKSRTSPAEGPAIAQWRRVEIDWQAAGQRATWTYLCAVDPAGNARVQRLAQ